MALARSAALLGALAFTFWPTGARAAVDFSSTIDGIELRPEIGTGLYGYYLTGNLGWMWIGVRDYDRRWLISWTTDAEAVLGGVAYEHPFYVLYGARATGQGEGGLRLSPWRKLSLYASATLDADVSAITQWGVPFNGGTSINNLDGLGGVYGEVDLRPGFGMSYLTPRHSFVAEAQLLGELDSAQSNLPGLVYLGGALHARYDRPNSFTASGEIGYAVTPSSGDPGLGISSYQGRWDMSLSAIKKAGRFFAGLGVSLSRVATQQSYAGGASYTSDAPVDAAIWILVGYRP